MMFCHITWCIMVILSYNTSPSEGMKLIVKTFQHCDSNEDYEFNYDVKLFWENELQYVDINATFKRPLSNDVKFNLKVEKFIAKKYIQVIGFGDRHACTAAHRYMGEFAYGLEQAAGLPRGSCPIRKGKFVIRHFLIESNKITLQSFPLGQLRFTTTLMDASNKVLGCVAAEIDNV